MTAKRPPRRMERRTPVWEAPAEILDLFPEISGNTINGLGETKSRPISPPMWRNPKSIAHGEVQNHITREYTSHEVLRTTMRAPGGFTPDPIAIDQTQNSPADWDRLVREFALGEAENSATKVGIVRFRQEWAFEGMDVPFKWIILLADRMEYEALSQAPEWEAAREVHHSYNRGTAAAREVANWIRGHGYEAEGHGGPGAGPVLLLPAAIEAGFGELGKHGSLIDTDLGSGFRISAVMTNLPLVDSAKPEPFFVDSFCVGCRICTDACPPAAITPDKQLVRGDIKWYVDFDKCLPYFAVSYGCGACIAICPWTKPDQAQRLTDVMRRKNAKAMAKAAATEIE